MANENTIGATLKFLKGESDILFAKSGILQDVAGDDYVKRTQTVGTSEEALGLGDLTSPGYILMFNRDATNYVAIRPGTGENDLIRVPPGGVALFYCHASAPFIIANTANCQVEYLLIEA